MHFYESVLGSAKSEKNNSNFIGKNMQNKVVNDVSKNVDCVLVKYNNNFIKNINFLKNSEVYGSYKYNILIVRNIVDVWRNV